MLKILSKLALNVVTFVTLILEQNGTYIYGHSGTRYQVYNNTECTSIYSATTPATAVRLSAALYHVERFECKKNKK